MFFIIMPNQRIVVADLKQRDRRPGTKPVQQKKAN